MIRVSVIIPCFNQGHFVDEAVHSVLAQTFRDFEIIIVNDGSTDEETRQILAGYEQEKTRVIHTENQGLAAARNNGIKEAAGEYILPLDADDRIGRTYLEQAVQQLDSRPELAIVYCRAQLFGAVETEWQLPEFSLAEMLRDNVIFCSAFFRRTAWQETGGYDLTLRQGWEDYDFWLTLLERGGQVYRIPEVLFHYRVAAESMVRARPRRHKVETFARIFRKHQQLFTDHIEVWVDRMLAGGEPYYQASLSAEGEGGQDPAWCRKVDTSSRCLRFPLTDRSLHGQILFHPADQPVAVRIDSIQLEQGADRLRDIAFSHNADFSRDKVCFFCSGNGAVQLTLPDRDNRQTADETILINIEYLAFGSGCMPLLIDLLQQSEENCPAGIEQPHQWAVSAGSLNWLQINFILFKQQLKCLRYCLSSSHYRALKKSNLLDQDYYLSHDRYLDPLRIHPLIHYLESGWQEGRNPNVLFEADWYRQFYDLAADRDPLLHYIEEGAAAGNNPNILFFTSYYGDRYPESRRKGQNPLSHYLYLGWQQGNKPDPLFDSGYYLARNPDVAASGMNPLQHYLRTGNRELRSPMPFFDMRFYCEANPSVARQWLFPILHFLKHGHEEGLSPNRFFDPDFYRKKYNLSELSGLELFLHFAERGAADNLWPSSLFDPEFYSRKYALASDSGIHPLEQYQEQGVAAGHYPCRAVADLPVKPVISILTPVYNTDEQLLRRCIHSVLYQAYPHWQLCLVDDGSSAAHIRPLLEEYAAMDSRIRIRLLPVNQGISPATNAAAKLADGEYLGFLDHDDELTPDALFRMVEAINEYGSDLLYSDEELVDGESRHLNSFHKPDYNAELLLSHNYVTHFVVLRRSLFAEVGGLAADCSGAQDYDLLLKAVEQAEQVHHVRYSLYKWRASETSTSVNHDQKGYADAAGLRALQAAVERRGIRAEVRPGQWKFYYELHRQVEVSPRISILILPAVATSRTVAWAEELATGCGNADIDIQLLLRKGETAAAATAGEDKRLTLHWLDDRETDAAALNRAVGQAAGGHLVFIRPGVVPEQENWLDILLGYSADAGCGIVGGMIVEDAEKDLAVPDLNDRSCALFRSFLSAGSVQLNSVSCPQNVLAPSFDFCMLERKLWQQGNGFDDTAFPEYFYGHDLAFRLREEAGIEHVFTPFCRAKGCDPDIQMTDPACSREQAAFQKRWQKLLADNPCYNENRLLREQQVDRAVWLQWIAGINGD